ncbi:uncharacterized protein K02A2.6-like [Coccinella septempunctata]|uniref:uncharacterized protein K02A2.6-like n=1 Tax=Coccinella septempunctata TaxID=41139 RepID=UPI001D06EFCC|nr:uncharacterized protein K02A2.6-like [Coccinella septempunctata]
MKHSNVSPKFFKARPLPHAIRDLVEQEINRLVEVGILTPVSFSEWATPVVPIIKKNGEIRLCADFKVTINPHIQVDQYPIPRIEDLFGRLQGGEQFTKLDLSQAYQQIAVDESSKKLSPHTRDSSGIIAYLLVYLLPPQNSKKL